MNGSNVGGIGLTAGYGGKIGQMVFCYWGRGANKASPFLRQINLFVFGLLLVVKSTDKYKRPGVPSALVRRAYDQKPRVAKPHERVSI